MELTDFVRVERDGELALVVVNHPPVNTINADVRDGLRQALGPLAASDIKAIILLCEDSTFFSGADIGEFSGPPQEEAYRQIFNAYEALPVPVGRARINDDAACARTGIRNRARERMQGLGGVEGRGTRVLRGTRGTSRAWIEQRCPGKAHSRCRCGRSRHDEGRHRHLLRERGHPGDPHRCQCRRSAPRHAKHRQADFALHEAGRLGQKNGKGYYRYESGNRVRLDDPDALQILAARAKRLSVERRHHSKEEILERCLYPLLNEGLRILEEGIALRASDIDVVWTAGYGFPRYRGGPMFYADTIGLKTVLEGMLKYQEVFGPMHWQPARLLTDLVEKGMTIAQWEAQRGLT